MNSRILEDKYEIIKEIKKGGFGIVYYGIDRNLSKPIAIKEIAPNLLGFPKYMDMFQDEALKIAKLSHPNIVHIYDLIKTADGRHYIIMEYIDGIDLEKVIRRTRKLGRKIPPHLAVYIVSEICIALDYAYHRRDAVSSKSLNLVHQDISPSNIMISRSGNVKLIDFGIALIPREFMRAMSGQKVVGKIHYMAPEQLTQGNHPEHRSDLFSLGLVLYECLIGRRVFSNREELVAAAKSGEWIREPLEEKGLPPILEKILHTAIEADLSKRYQSAMDLYQEAMQYLVSCHISGDLMEQLADYIKELFLGGRLTTNNEYIQRSF
ncbi:MAG: protein kinase [bacterium]